MKPDYSKLPKSWGVKGSNNPEQKKILQEKLEPILSRGWSYNIDLYYGFTMAGIVDYTYKSNFQNIYTIEEFIELTEGRSELPERWYIQGSEDLRLWFTRNGIKLTGDRAEYFYYPIDYSKPLESWDFTTYEPSINIITLFDFKQLLGKQTKTEPAMNMQEKVVIPQELLIEANKDATEVQKGLLITNIDFFTREATKEFIKKFYDRQVQKGCSWKKRIEDAFPFVKEEEINLSTGKFDDKGLFNTGTSDSSTNFLISVRGIDRYKNKGFWLNNEYNWRMVKEEDGYVLIPTKK